MPTKKVKVFYSYSHKDAAFRDRIEQALTMLKRGDVISQWHDRGIGAGSEWRSQIDSNLESSDLILLLVSPSFLASDYCYDLEMKRAMELHETGRARVIPVILRPCDWKAAPFAKLQALPRDGKAIIHWRPQDDAYQDLTRSIREVVTLIQLELLEEEIKSRNRIMVLDDERVISDTLVMILNQSGFMAASGYSGEHGMRLAEYFKPDMVVTDVIMGGLNGIDASIQLMNKFPDCKILLFSGQAATADLLEKARANGHEFEILAKPVHPQDLLYKLRKDGLDRPQSKKHDEKSPDRNEDATTDGIPKDCRVNGEGATKELNFKSPELDRAVDLALQSGDGLNGERAYSKLGNEFESNNSSSLFQSSLVESKTPNLLKVLFNKAVSWFR